MCYCSNLVSLFSDIWQNNETVSNSILKSLQFKNRTQRFFLENNRSVKHCRYAYCSMIWHTNWQIGIGHIKKRYSIKQFQTKNIDLKIHRNEKDHSRLISSNSFVRSDYPKSFQVLFIDYWLRMFIDCYNLFLILAMLSVINPKSC